MSLLYLGKGSPRLVIESSSQRKRIISSVHDSSHFGINRTIDMITAKYYWPGVTSDIKEYVRRELKCSFYY